uniref:Cytidyltransferase-like domain-containing protein n=1 Tax=Parascaris univalens TaxID=6257 RepID=A0A914ZQS2_PARUN
MDSVALDHLLQRLLFKRCQTLRSAEIIFLQFSNYLIDHPNYLMFSLKFYLVSALISSSIYRYYCT